MPTGIYDHSNNHTTKGMHISEDHKEKIRLKSPFQEGYTPYNKGMKMSQEYCEKLKSVWTEERREKNRIKATGNKYHYYKDRTKLKKRDERNDSTYNNWRLEVYKRDSYKCKINSIDCKGRIIAHHILPWRDYPELRYEINNGITLCHFHHPRKRVDEQRLMPTFKSMVEVIGQI